MIAAILARALRAYELTYAVEFLLLEGVAEALIKEPTTPADLARDFGFRSEAVELVMRALESSGILDSRDGRFCLNIDCSRGNELQRLRALAQYHGSAREPWPEARSFFVQGKGKARIGQEVKCSGLWSIHYDHREVYRGLLSASYNPLVIDIGGGSGLCAQEFVEICPGAEVIIVDPDWYGPETILACKNIRYRRRLPRIVGATLVTFINVLHCLKQRSVLSYLRRARSMLSPKGKIVVQEMVEKKGPAWGSPTTTASPVVPVLGVEHFLLSQAVSGGIILDWRISDLEKFFALCDLSVVSVTVTDETYTGYPSKIWTLEPSWQ